MQSFLEKMCSCQNNLEKSYTKKKIKHTPSGYTLFTNFSANNKSNCYRGKDFMEKFNKNF